MELKFEDVIDDVKILQHKAINFHRFMLKCVEISKAVKTGVTAVSDTEIGNMNRVYEEQRLILKKMVADLPCIDNSGDIATAKADEDLSTVDINKSVPIT